MDYQSLCELLLNGTTNLHVSFWENRWHWQMEHNPNQCHLCLSKISLKTHLHKLTIHRMAKRQRLGALNHSESKNRGHRARASSGVRWLVSLRGACFVLSCGFKENPPKSQVGNLLRRVSGFAASKTRSSNREERNGSKKGTATFLFR